MQTFTDWNDVPATVEHKIRKLWNREGTACYEQSRDTLGEPITVYRLASYNVAENAEYLTDEQLKTLFFLALRHGLVLDSFLHSLAFQPETVRIHDEVYYLPGIIIGTWPHCGLFGGMDETGYIHT